MKKDMRYGGEGGESWWACVKSWKHHFARSVEREKRAREREESEGEREEGHELYLNLQLFLCTFTLIMANEINQRQTWAVHLKSFLSVLIN